jgi:hypothetical protein
MRDKSLFSKTSQRRTSFSAIQTLLCSGSTSGFQKMGCQDRANNQLSPQATMFLQPLGQLICTRSETLTKTFSFGKEMRLSFRQQWFRLWSSNRASLCTWKTQQSKRFKCAPKISFTPRAIVISATSITAPHHFSKRAVCPVTIWFPHQQVYTK